MKKYNNEKKYLKYIGMNYCGHDSSLVVLDCKNKEIFAVTTERITRIKHDSLDIEPILKSYDRSKFSDDNFFVLLAQGYNVEFDWIYNVYYLKKIRKIIKPKYINDLKFLKSRLKVIPFSKKEYVKFYIKNKFTKFLTKIGLIREKDIAKNIILETFNNYGYTVKQLVFVDHHLSHALSSFYFSEFYQKDKAIVLTLDGYGDKYFSKLFCFDKNGLYNEISKSEYDSSIGIIYQLFTIAMDLTPNSDEGKVEALAAYGKPDNYLLNLLNSAVNFDKNKLEFISNKDNLNKLYNIQWLKKVKDKVREENFCASVQVWLENIVVNYLNEVYKKYQIPNLCLSGGL